MYTRYRLKSGFTIVELLIVIVVIGVLAAITIVAYNGIQSRGRDVQRLTEMDRFKKALEIYYVDNGVYPECTAGDNVCTSTGYSGNTSTIPITPALNPDPLNVNTSYGYYYARAHTKAATGDPVSTGDPKDYVVAMRLENNGGMIFGGWNNATNLNWYYTVNN